MIVVNVLGGCICVVLIAVTIAGVLALFKSGGHQ